MSTDELVRGIRRIVGDRDAKPTGLADAEARKAIGISRGIGFIRSDGTVGGGGAEGGGNDASPPDVPTDQPDSGGGVPADAGGTTGGGDAGGKTVLNGDAATVDDATVDSTVLGTITGTDPATGNLTSVKFDSLAGIEYTPPEGWDDPDIFPDPFIENSPLAYAICASAFGGAAADYEGFGTWVNDGGGVRCYTAGGFQGTVGGVHPAPPAATCSSLGGTPNLGGFCGVSDPSAVPHPSDGTCDVVYDHEAGGYKGHTNDPDCSAAQKTASNFVIIRSQSDPSRYFRYTRLANGGTKVTEVDSGGVPKPGTVTKLLDGQGSVVGFVDVSLDNFYQ